jgi:formylglycine-generating enzyme required for sulfatase activity
MSVFRKLFGRSAISSITGKDGAEMILIPEGKFMMGSPSGEGDDNEHPQHQVYLSAYYIDKYPVTCDLYDKFCEATGRTTPKDNKGRGNRPVTDVTWDDANDYARWAGKRLPTEAEYEKAIRGGTTTRYFWGDDETRADKYAWLEIHPVGEKKPNAYGLYDIVGNVWEWCWDYYIEAYGKPWGYYANSPMKDPQGPENKYEHNHSGHVRRGGGGFVERLRSAYRGRYRDGFQDGPNSSNSFLCCKTSNCGFRCAKTP